MGGLGHLRAARTLQTCPSTYSQRTLHPRIHFSLTSDHCCPQPSRPGGCNVSAGEWKEAPACVAPSGCRDQALRESVACRENQHEPGLEATPQNPQKD